MKNRVIVLGLLSLSNIIFCPPKTWAQGAGASVGASFSELPDLAEKKKPLSSLAQHLQNREKEEEGKRSQFVPGWKTTAVILRVRAQDERKKTRK